MTKKPPRPEPRKRNPRALPPRNVVSLGLVSLFNDISSEMLYPVIPMFLTAVLGAPVAVVGLIEGVAEATGNILKVFSGRFSDRVQKRKPLVVAGYSLSALAKLMLGAAFAWPLVLVARFTDRVGKGVRTSARDALIAGSTDERSRGRAFGFHRSMDSAGAVIGPLVALFLIRVLGENNLRPIFFIAFIPALAGVILLALLVRETGSAAAARPGGSLLAEWRATSRALKYFLLVTLVFSLGNSSDAFLILRTRDLGFSMVLTVLAYVVFNLVYTAFAFPLGILSDRVGPRRILAAGFFLFSLVYLAFGLAPNRDLVWLLFVLYGFYMAMTDGIAKAYVSTLAPADRAATAFGLYQTIAGVGIFFASLIAGLLWTRFGPRLPFYLGSAAAALAGLLFLCGGRSPGFAEAKAARR